MTSQVYAPQPAGLFKLVRIVVPAPQAQHMVLAVKSSSSRVLQYSGYMVYQGSHPYP